MPFYKCLKKKVKKVESQITNKQTNKNIKRIITRNFNYRFYSLNSEYTYHTIQGSIKLTHLQCWYIFHALYNLKKNQTDLPVRECKFNKS